MGNRDSKIISPALKVLAAVSREVSVSLGFILCYDSDCLSSLEHRPLLPQMVIQQHRIVLSAQRRILGGLIEMRTDMRCDRVSFSRPVVGNLIRKGPLRLCVFTLNALASINMKLSLMTAVCG